MPLTAAQLALYMEKAITSIEAEFRNVATTSTVRLEELPPGVEAKNRYANVLPIPETRVHIRVQDNQPQDTPEQYINANYIKVRSSPTPVCLLFFCVSLVLISAVGSKRRASLLHCLPRADGRNR